MKQTTRAARLRPPLPAAKPAAIRGIERPADGSGALTRATHPVAAMLAEHTDSPIDTTTTDLEREWLETNGLGGYASGTVSGMRTRRYHALLVHATEPPAGRVVLWSGFDAVVDTPSGSFALSTQCYAPNIVQPDGARRLLAFGIEPWPTWRFRLEDGTVVQQEIVMPHGHSACVVAWRLLLPKVGVTLRVRPFLCGRDDHALLRQSAVDMTARPSPGGWEFKLTERVPALRLRCNGTYVHEPYWYRNFRYAHELQRGYDHDEDLPSPGELHFDLGAGEAVIVASAGASSFAADEQPLQIADSVRDSERRRRATFASPLERAADAYLVRRGDGLSVIAGYPWFADWGRDTFLALRGLCLATGRLAAARDVLLQWTGVVDRGMVPNRFPDRGGAPEFNSVDASLWFVVATHEFLQRGSALVDPAQREVLRAACAAIVEGYARGTRHGIGVDTDGLLAAGERGQQLTWMDARVGDVVITPRIGKPVELQALWFNALRIVGEWDDRWQALLSRVQQAFHARFWNPTADCLFDVVDVDHVAGTHDASLRPNQLLAVGGLPFRLLTGARAQSVVRCVESHLLTPLGVRTLAADDPDYRPRYEGDQANRDRAYHQGTVWPWLLGSFVEAWIATGRGTVDEARARFLPPLLAHLDQAGIGHVSEIADAEPPHRPRGCPFQAWSVGELLRLQHVVLAAPVAAAGRTSTAGAHRQPNQIVKNTRKP